MFPERQQTIRSCVAEEAKAVLADRLGGVRITQVVTDFQRMKGSWSAAEAGHWERPGEAAGEDATSVAIAIPGLEG